MKRILDSIDKYELYVKSVQAPQEDARLLARRFQKIAGRPLRILREDFCGTANLLCEFIKLHPNNIGIGVDLDSRPLRWCKKNNFPALSFEQRLRMRLFQADVREIRTTSVDMICALNYSYSVFHTRNELLQYFKRAQKQLKPGGIFVCDVHGGSAVPVEDKDVWDVDGFQYVWEVSRFDPITHRIVCKIHYQFSDGSILRNAFRYDWRLWTIPELLELYEEAGLQNVQVLWEGTDPNTSYGNGVMRRVTKGRAEGAWYAMILGQK